MSFNPDARKQAQEVVFSQKIKKTFFHHWFSIISLCL